MVSDIRRNSNVWRSRITRARKRGRFLPTDEKLAGSFTSCAVGEQALLLGCEQLTTGYGITRFESSGVPRPVVLAKGHEGDFITVEAYELGMDFYRAVQENQVERAAELLSQIRKLKVVRPPVEPLVQPPVEP